MPSTSENNKRIAKNTLMLYIRMFVIMGVTLYTSRVVLRLLGITDYGIYNVVGGFVVMFAVISNSLSAAISRFITFELGRGAGDRLRKVFFTTVIIQLAMAGIIVILAETVGLWFLCTHMNIPPDRMTAAHWVYQFSILAFAVKLAGIPYDACIKAHEHMSAFAGISIFEATGNLTVALLIAVTPGDRLVWYAALMCAIAIAVRLLNGWYCGRHFDECHGKWSYDRRLVKQIFGFSGWNFIGASSGVLRDQGVNVLLNLFCGPAMNAARGIGMQVSAAVTSFSTSFVTAINPQITKSYAAGDRPYTMTLVFQGARFSFYLLLLIALPILAETSEILRIWLGHAPEHSIAFVRLGVLYVMSEAISTTMVTLMLATGRIRNYQLLVGGCQMLNFPVSYLLLKTGCPPESTMAAAIGISFGCLFLRLYMLRNMTGLPVGRFLHRVLANILAVGLLSTIAPYCIMAVMPAGTMRLLLSCAACLFSTSAMILYVGCSRKERAFVFNKISVAGRKILKRNTTHP